MSQTDKMMGWMRFFRDEATNSANRALRSMDRMRDGNYDTKDAYKDWYELATCGLKLLPDPPDVAAAAAGDFPVLVRLHSNSSTAGEVRMLPARADPGLALDWTALTDAGENAAKTIPRDNVTVRLLDDGYQLLVELTNLDAVDGLDLVSGDELSGTVTLDGQTLATIVVFVSA